MWHIIIQFAISIRIKTEITHSHSLSLIAVVDDFFLLLRFNIGFDFSFIRFDFSFFRCAASAVRVDYCLTADEKWQMKLSCNGGRLAQEEFSVFIWMGWYTQTADLCLCVCKRLDLPMPFDKLREVMRHKAMQRINKNKTNRCVWTGYTYIHADMRAELLRRWSYFLFLFSSASFECCNTAADRHPKPI